MLAGLPGGYSGREPPDPIPNSEVKTFSADGSVGSPHVRVGHRQALLTKSPVPLGPGDFFVGIVLNSRRVLNSRFHLLVEVAVRQLHE